MSAKVGPSNIKPGDRFRLPSGKQVIVREWLEKTGGWHCFTHHASGYIPNVNDVDDWIFLRHEFLLRYGVKL